jgi:hypothetical protein
MVHDAPIVGFIGCPVQTSQQEQTMRYFRVYWTDPAGEHFSDPISTWTSAEIYRQQIGGDAVVLRY